MDPSTNSNDFEANVFFQCVESSFEPMMLTDKQGRLTYVNEAWVKIYGYSRLEALGQTPRMIRSEHQGELFYKRMWSQILDSQKGYWKGELINRAKNGKLITVLLTITPFKNQNHEVAGYMGIAVDITQQKLLEQQVLQQDRLASIGMLAGGLAHEIGTPLGVIQGRAEYMMMDTQDPDVKKGLGVIMSQIERISKLLHSLLHITRAPEKFELRSVQMAGLLNEVKTLMDSQFKANEIHFDTSAFADATVWGGPSQIQQVLLNLLINAVHAIRKAKLDGQPGPHSIKVSSKITEEAYSLIVTDTGCGIAHEHLTQLFQPFFSTKSSGEGTGLGLSIVLKLMQEMKGSITAASDGPGCGASFTLQFRHIH